LTTILAMKKGGVHDRRPFKEAGTQGVMEGFLDPYCAGEKKGDCELMLLDFGKKFSSRSAGQTEKKMGTLRGNANRIPTKKKEKGAHPSKCHTCGRGGEGGSAGLPIRRHTKERIKEYGVIST